MVVSLAHPNVPFHINGFTPPFDLESGVTNVHQNTRYLTEWGYDIQAKSFQEMRKKTETLGQFIVIHRHQQSIHTLLSFLWKPHRLHKDREMTFLWVKKIWEGEVAVFQMKKQKCRLFHWDKGWTREKHTWLEWTWFLFLSTLRNRKVLNCQAATLRHIYVERGPGCFLLKEIYDFNKGSH